MRLPLQKGHTIAVLNVKWSPNDELLLTYSAADGYLNVWKMPEGRLLWGVEASEFVKQKHDEHYALRTFAWSDDSRLIATGSENGTAQVWNAATGRLIWKARVADEYVAGLGFSHDKKMLAVTAAPEDEQLKLTLLDAAKGTVLKELQGMGESKFLTYYFDDKILFSADDKQLLIGDRRGIVTRWNVADGRLLSKRELELCKSEQRLPNSFVYSADLSLIAVRCGENTDVLETTSGAIVRTTKMSVDFTYDLAISHDKQIVAAGDSGSFKLFNPADGVERDLPDSANLGCGCDFNQKDTLFAFTDYFEDKTVKVLDLKSGQTIKRLEAHPGVIRALVFSPDGARLASGSDDRIVRLWNAKDGKLLAALEGHTKPVQALAFSPDSRILVSASKDQTMKVWDAQTGALLHSMTVEREGIDGVSSISFSPDGKRLVTTLSATVGLWDTGMWSLLRTFTTDEPHTSGEMTYCCGSTVLSARFSTDGKQIISGHEDGTIKVWDTEREELFHKLPPVRIIQTNDRNESFALSLDGKILVANSGEKPPQLWNWVDGKMFGSLGDDASYAHNIVFSPDGQSLLTSDIGGGLALWDAGSGKLLREFDNGYSSSDDAIAFSPDGQRFASGGENQNIVMWDVKSGKRLWHLLPVKEKHRPTPEETAEQKLEAQRAEEEAERIEQEVAALAANVSISFEHYGEPNNPAEMHLAETGQPNKSLDKQSKEEATGIWLRLHNDSPLPISLFTESIYLPSKEHCGYQPSAKKFYYGLCEGAEIGIRFSVFDANGKSVRYGFDFGAETMLPPKTSALFSLPRGLLKDGHYIVVSFTFLKGNAKGKLDEYGKSREIKFTEAGLP
jgi:WD40 repeat protein